MNKANKRQNDEWPEWKNKPEGWPFYDEREDETTEQLKERIKAMEKEISRLLKAYKELNKAINTHKSKQQ